jgi:hypothetical protein
VNGVGHTSHSMVLKVTFFYAVCVAHFGRYWLPSLVSFDSSNQYLSNSIDDVITRVLVWNLFFSFIFSHNSRIIEVICRLSKMCYFSKYFLHCVILLIFFVATLKKKTRKNHGLSATWLQVVHVKMLKDSTVLNSFSFDSILVGPW